VRHIECLVKERQMMSNKQDWLKHHIDNEGKAVGFDSLNVEQAFSQEQALKKALTGMGEQAIPKHSMHIMLKKAAWQNRLKSWMPTSIAYGAGLSSAFAVMLVFNLNFVTTQSSPMSPEQLVSVQQVVHYTSVKPENQVLKTMVALESKKDVPWAMVTIHLPEGVELEGFPGLSTVEYDTALFKGQNQLPLTLIRSNNQTAGEVEVEINADESPQLFSVPLQVAHQSNIF